MDEITHTIMPSGGQWGGAALGAGVGGLLGSWIGNGGFGGFGGRGAAGVGYDTGAINGIANQLGNVQTQIANADRDLLMQTANSNQFVGNLVNTTGDAIVGAVNGAARDTQAGIFQNTLTQTQNQGATNVAMAQGFGGIAEFFKSAERLVGSAELLGGVGDGLRDLNHRVEVAGARNGESGLDHVDAEFDERFRDFEFFLQIHARARRLFAVAQGGVENK